MSTVGRTRVTVVIPVYCERDTLPPLIAAIFSQEMDVALEVWIVDDNSPDGTGRAVDDLRTTYPTLRLVSRPEARGRGAAVMDAFGRLVESPAPPDLIVEMDGDGSHEAASLPSIIAAASDAEVVIGSRYVPGGAADLSGKRRLLSKLANAYARIVLGLPYADCSTGYRCYRRGVLEKIGISQIGSGGHAAHLELLYELDRAGVTVAEVPIHYRVRTAGESKVTLSETLRVAWVLLRVRWGSKKIP